MKKRIISYAQFINLWSIILLENCHSPHQGMVLQLWTMSQGGKLGDFPKSFFIQNKNKFDCSYHSLTSVKTSIFLSVFWLWKISKRTIPGGGGAELPWLNLPNSFNKMFFFTWGCVILHHLLCKIIINWKIDMSL